MNRLVIAGVLAVIVLTGAAAYMISGQGSESALASVPVTYRDLTARVRISGTTEAQRSVDLSFRNDGIVGIVPVAVGDTVATGTLLAALQKAILQDQIDQAMAALQAQKANLQNLLNGTRRDQVAITQAQLDSSQSGLKSANQELLSSLRNAQGTADIAVRMTIDQFIQNPSLASSVLTIPVVSSAVGASVLTERQQIQPALDTWASRLANLSAASANDLVSASRDMHAYLDTIAAILDGLTRLLSSGNSEQFASSQTAVGSARSSIMSVRSALTSADQGVASAQSAVGVAQKQLALDQGGSTQSTITAQRAAVASAQARVNELEDALGDLRILAPFSGTVASLTAKASEAARAGIPEVSLISNDPLKIEGYVPESHYAELAVGQSASIRFIAFPNDTFQGTIGRIDPVAVLQDQVPNVKVTIYLASADARLKPGLTATADIVTEQKPHALSVPLAAVQGFGASATVLRKVAGKVESTPVTLGIQDNDGYVEIVSGLSELDTVLVNETRQYRIVPN
ncbi:efflux RND transporter periplasmic adaptor subunit [Patescibacteria group bacterium]|nr:efflux RND transporter periplasmic adaptor subunit [Patescibacteria group bacterium]